MKSWRRQALLVTTAVLSRYCNKINELQKHYKTSVSTEYRFVCVHVILPLLPFES